VLRPKLIPPWRWNADSPAGRLSGAVGHGEAFPRYCETSRRAAQLCGWNPAKLIRARQHASISDRHHLQCLQGRWGFEDWIVRRCDSGSEYLNAVRKTLWLSYVALRNSVKDHPISENRVLHKVYHPQATLGKNDGVLADHDIIDPAMEESCYR